MHATQRFDRSDIERVHDALAALGPEKLADRLGLSTKPIQRAGDEIRIPCPVHGGKDPNFAIKLKTGRIVYHCHSACADRGGDAIKLVGEVERIPRFRDQLARAASLVGIALEVPEPRQAARGLKGYVPPKTLKPRPEPEPELASLCEYPPALDVLDLWLTGSVDVTADATCSAWLRDKRALCPETIADRGLCRFITENASQPAWARFGGQSWLNAGYRVLVPFYDAGGLLQALRAGTTSAEAKVKRVSPFGYSTKGLVMADSLGLEMLKTGKRPGWWQAEAAFRVVIAEGEPDFLTWATRSSDADELAPAVLGVIQGSWTGELAARIPSGSKVIVRTDPDPAGDKYAETINRTLAGRCEVRRLSPKPGRSTL